MSKSRIASVKVKSRPSKKVPAKKSNRESEVPSAVKAVLYIDSAGKCAICGKHLTVGNKNVSKVAHILPSSPNGPRGRYRTTQDVNALSNLILLCGDHHDEVDAKVNEDRFPPDLLYKQKAQLESWASRQNPQDPSAITLNDIGDLLKQNLAGSEDLVFILDKVETLILTNDLESAGLVLDALDGMISGKASLRAEHSALKAKILWKRENISAANDILNQLLRTQPENQKALYLKSEIALDDNADITVSMVKVYFKSAYYHLLKARHSILDNVKDYEFVDESVIQEFEPYEQYTLYIRYAALAFMKNDSMLGQEYLKKADDLFPNHPGVGLLQINTLFVNYSLRQENDFQTTQKFQTEVREIIGRIRQHKLSLRQQIELQSYDIKVTLVGIGFQRADNMKEKLENFLALIEKSYLSFLNKNFLGEYLTYFHLTQDEFSRITAYLKQFSESQTEGLIDLLLPSVVKFSLEGEHLQETIKELKLEKYSKLLDAIKEKNAKLIAEMLLELDESRVPSLIESIFDDMLRLEVLSHVPKDDLIYKLLKIEALKKLGRVPETLPIIKSIQAAELTYEAAYKISFLAEENKVWEIVVSSLERLLPLLTDNGDKAEALLRLVNAYQKLKNEPAVLKYSIILQEIQESLTEHNLKLFSHIVIQSYLAVDNPQGALDFVVKLPGNAFDFGIYMFVSDTYARLGNGPSALENMFKAFDIAEDYPAQNFVACYPRLLTIDKLKPHIPSDPTISNGKFVKLDKLNKWFFIGDEGEPWDAVALSESDERYKALIGRIRNEVVEWPSSQYLTESTKTILQVCDREEYLHFRAFEELENEADQGSPYIKRISIEEDNFDNVIKLMQDQQRNDKEFFDLYSKSPLPIGSLIVKMGGTLEAVSKINSAQKGFIHATTGNPTLDDPQLEAALKAINSQEPIYIDGMVVSILCFMDKLDVLNRQGLQFVFTPSVVNDLRKWGEKFSSSFDASVGRLGLHNGKLNYQPTNAEEEIAIRKRFFDAAQYITQYYKVETGVSNETLLQEWEYNTIFPPIISEPFSYANKAIAFLLTDDFNHIQAHRLTGSEVKCRPFSSITLFRALLIRKKITLKEYLEFTGRLAYARYKHVPISDDLMYMAVVNREGPLSVFKPENLEFLNLRLTLSEEYGVTLENSAAVVSSFLWKVLNDDSIPPELFGQILDIVLPQALHKRDAVKYAGIVLTICKQNAQSKVYLTDSFQGKLRMLGDKLKSQLLVTMSAARIILPPKK